MSWGSAGQQPGDVTIIKTPDTSQDEATASGISALTVVTARLFVEHTTDVAKILPQGEKVFASLVNMLSHTLLTHHSHQHAGILAIQLACLLQSFSEEQCAKISLGLGEPARNAVSKGNFRTQCTHSMPCNT